VESDRFQHRHYLMRTLNYQWTHPRLGFTKVRRPGKQIVSLLDVRELVVHHELQYVQMTNNIMVYASPQRGTRPARKFLLQTHRGTTLDSCEVEVSRAVRAFVWGSGFRLHFAYLPWRFCARTSKCATVRGIGSFSAQALFNAYFELPVDASPAGLHLGPLANLPTFIHNLFCVHYECIRAFSSTISYVSVLGVATL